MRVNRPQIEIIPTLFLGCGGRGTMAIHYCREIVLEEVFKGDSEELKRNKQLIFLAVDSATQLLEDTGRQYDFQVLEIAADQNTLQNALNDYTFPNAGDSVAAVMNHLPAGRNYQRMLDRVTHTKYGMQTCPPMGRINLLCSWSRVYKELKGIIENSWRNIESNTLQVFVISSLYGGTGAGTHIDIAAMIRFIFRDLELSQPFVYGIFILPDVVKTPSPPLLRANAYACLKELDYFLSGNPYSIRLANGKELTIENKGPDCIFNSVFLVNDRNKFKGEPAVRLSGPDEVCRMIGELIFYWSCTTLGKHIPARLVDAPLDSSKNWAPRHSPEKRITAYSTFGLATASIPYDNIKQNLSVSLAIKIMKELAGEQEEWYLSEDLFQKTGIDDDNIKRKLNLRLPSFMSYESFDQFKEDNDYNWEDAFGNIKKQVDTFLRNQRNEEKLKHNIKDIEEQFYNKVREVKNEFLNRSGLVTASGVLTEIENRIDGALKEIETFEYSEYDQSIKKALEKLEESISGKKDLFLLNWFLGPDKEKLESCFLGLKGLIIKQNKSALARLKRDIFQRCLEKLKNVKKELEEEKQKFGKIINLLMEKTKPYYESTIHFSPVSENVIKDFIEKFDFPEGYSPKELSDIIKKEGLEIEVRNDTKKIPVSDFDDYPQEVAEAIFKLACEKVEEFSRKYLYKSFSESGFFKSKIDYFNALQELDRRSSPYLEYTDGEDFEPTYKEGFVIYPPNEINEWKEGSGYTLTPTRQFDIEGDVETSPFSITMIQFHHGLPLYSIDEIELWDQAYRDYIEHDDRPIHKFRKDMKDPVIMNRKIKINLTEEEIKDLYDWAIKVSEKGIYSVLLKEKNVWILYLCKNYDVDSFFYDAYDKIYLGLESIKAMLNNASQTLKDELSNQLNNILNQNENLRQKLKIYDKSEFQNDLLKVLEKIAQLKTSNDVIQVNEEGKIYINPDSKYFPRSGEFLRTRFIKKKQNPRPKDGLTYKSILQALKSRQIILFYLIMECDKALRFIESAGRIDEVPPPDFIKEKLR